MEVYLERKFGFIKILHLIILAYGTSDIYSRHYLRYNILDSAGAPLKNINLGRMLAIIHIPLLQVPRRSPHTEPTTFGGV